MTLNSKGKPYVVSVFTIILLLIACKSPNAPYRIDEFNNIKNIENIFKKHNNQPCGLIRNIKMNKTSSIINERLMDSLKKFMIREEVNLGNSNLFIDYYILLTIEKDSFLVIKMGVSNLPPYIVDTTLIKSGKYFTLENRRIFIVDRAQHLSNELYNPKKLNSYIKPENIEDVGSGYIGGELIFIW